MTVRARGFTLMETLVMLVLVSVTVALMFQMLGSYRIARERFIAQSGAIDRQALFEAWFADSVHGLRAIDGSPMQGTATGFEAVTLNPLFGSPGAPARVQWTLVAMPDGGRSVRYSEDGVERWTLPLAGAGEARFAFLGDDGERHATWPPATGLRVALPAAVALVREGAPDARVQVAAVHGPRTPRIDPFEMEIE